MTPIEMARECYISCFVEETLQSIIDLTRSGEVDGQAAIQSALAMHTMRQAEIDAKDADIAELVECLSESEGVLATIAKEPDVNPWLVDVRKLLAKHRPDASAKWDEGVEA